MRIASLKARTKKAWLLISGSLTRLESLKERTRQGLNSIPALLRQHRREVVWALIFSVIAGVAADRGLKFFDKRAEEQALRKMQDAVVTVVVYNKDGKEVNQGSGVFVNSHGLLVTSYGLVKGGIPRIEARLQSRAVYKLQELKAVNEGLDIAVLQFDAKETPVAIFGDSDRIESGLRVLAIGTPLGLARTVSEGRISHPRLKLGTFELIQFTAPLAFGNKGGGLFAVRGDLLGVTAMPLGIPSQLQKEGPAQNLSVAVPANFIKRVMDGNDRTFTTDSPDYWYSQGVIEENQKKYSKAIDDFKKAIRLNPRYVDAYIELAYVYYLQERFDLQLEVLERAVKLAPNNAEAWASLGGAYEDLERYDDAIKAYIEAVSLDRRDKNSIHELGILYLAHGEKKLALEQIKKLTELDPGLGKELKMILDRMK